MGPSRLARHSEQNDNSVNDMRFTSETRKTMNDSGTSCPTVKQLMTLASVYERADAYNRAALEPVIRRAYETFKAGKPNAFEIVEDRQSD